MAAPERDPDARRILVVTPGFENAVRAELRPFLVGPRSDPSDALAAPSAPGIVDAVEWWPDVPIDPVFARQQLPAATARQASSVAGLAEAAYQVIEAALDAATGPFTIHSFAPTGAELGLASRAELIATELLSRLRQRRRRAARRYQDAAQAHPAFVDGSMLIQLLLVARDRLWISSAEPRRLPRGGWDLAPWPGGIAPVADDRRPPSRAYRKLEEAFLWMETAPQKDELCVDLGGAPGGWSYTALRRGARVIAVDRAPLEPPVRGHKRLTMIEGNAFTYEPPTHETPVDWMLSDVICEPARALTQLQRWLRQGWCRQLVMTVKFKGQDGYAMLANVRATLEQARCPRWRIKHLQHNKNEVTVMASTGATGPPAPPGSAG